MMAEGRLSNCAEFFDEQDFLVGQVEISRGGSLEEGRVYWYLDAPFTITIPTT